MTTSWEELFSPKVIDKAKKMLEEQSKLLESFEIESDQDGEVLVFTIKDHQKYIVKISLAADPGNYQMTCGCKEGQKGNNCLHMAIALMAWDIMEEEILSHENNDINLAMSVAQTASEESLRLFLSRLFVVSPDMFTLFQEDFPQETAVSAELAVPFRKIDDIIAAYLNQEGLINGNYLLRLRNELAEYLYQTNAAFLSQGNWVSPWEIVCYTMQRINNLHEDDSVVNRGYASVHHLVTMVLDEWEELLELLDFTNDDLKKFAFDSLTKLFETTTIRATSLESVLSLYLDQFDAPEFQQQQLPVLQKQYKIAREKFMQNRDEKVLGLWVAALLNLLTDLDMTEQAAKLYEKHQNLFLVQLWHLEDLIFEGQIEAMNHELNELKAKVKDDPSAMNKLFSFQREMAGLLEFFEQREFEEEQNEFIKKWQRYGDARQYTKMKNELTPEQWLQFRGEYAGLMKGRPELLASLKADNDLDALLAELKQQNDFKHWRQYHDLFNQEHAADFLAAYEAEVKAQLKYVYNGRPQYKRAARIIAEMAEFDGGTPRAQALIKELIAMYPQRPAMIDELEQVSRLL